MTTQPHVSIVSHLFDLTDRDELLACLRKVATTLPPLRIAFAELYLATAGGATRVIASPELETLRSSIAEQLPGVVASSSDLPWRPHLTVYQSEDPDIRRNAERLARSLDLGSGFRADSLDLVGRLGEPPGGTRTIIATVQLQGAAQAHFD